MSIMDFFRGGPAPAQEPAQPATPAQPTEPTAPANPADPASSGNPAPQGESSALDAFKDIWNNEPAKEGEPDPNAAYDPSASLNINPEEIQKAVSSIDFTQTLTPDTLAAISEGGEGAQKAFASALNQVSQHVFSQSMIANATLVKQALAQSTSAFDSRAEQLLRQSRVSDEVSKTNPVFNHPVAKPMVHALEQQLMRKYPQASHEEIAKQANQMFASFADEFSKPERERNKQSQTADDTDWEAFFNS